MLTVWACVLLLVDLFIPKGKKWITALLAPLGLGVSHSALSLSQIGEPEATGFNGMVVLDGFSTFLNALLLVSGLLGVALAYGYVKRMDIERGEYYTLLLFSITGMMLMAQAADLIIVFLALELLSIPLYVLAAFARPRWNQRKRDSNTSCSARSQPDLSSTGPRWSSARRAPPTWRASSPPLHTGPRACS